MASTYTDLGLELMATGENAGTWGTKTNANLSLIEQLTGGVLSISIAGRCRNTSFNNSRWCFNRYCSTKNFRIYRKQLQETRVVTFPLTYRNFLHY